MDNYLKDKWFNEAGFKADIEGNRRKYLRMKVTTFKEWLLSENRDHWNKKGEIHFKQDGKAYVMELTAGTLKVMTLKIQGKEVSSRLVDLTFAGKGGSGWAFVTFSTADGPKGECSVMNLKVMTPQGKTSIWSAQKGTCTHSVKSCSEKGVEGSATFTGNTDDGKGGNGKSLSDMTFSAAP